MDNTIRRDNLILALVVAIEVRETEEKKMKYTSDSAGLEGWRVALRCLQGGGRLEIRE